MHVLGDIPKRNNRLYGNKVGLVVGDKKFSYQEINNRVNRFSNGLKGLGLHKGDKVAFMAENCHEIVEAYFALAKAGLVIVPVNARLSADEASYVIDHSDATAFFVHAAVKATEMKKRDGLKGLDKVRHFFMIGGVEQGFQSYEDLLQNSLDAEPEETVDPDDIYLIMYTSGSTGRPKGVIGTHRNVMSNTNMMTLDLRIVEEDITLVVMPMYHNGGLWPTFTHFYRGAKVILSHGFGVEETLKAIETERVTFLNLVPTTLGRIVRHPDLDKYNLKSLRMIMYGGGPIAPTQLRKALEVMGTHLFYNGLGCTEANGELTNFSGADHALEGPMAAKLGSVGKDGIGIEVRIADEQGNEMPRGEVGEIIAKGDKVSPGYWKMPEETAKTFRNGWLHTGDLGYRDEDGYVFVVDRKKEIIISGGENVSPHDVEQVLYQHPAVKEACVIGVPDEEWGEVVKAIISLKPEYQGKVSGAEVIEFCKPRLAGFQRPKSVDIMDDLPKTAIGKIAKKELKDLYKQQRS